MKSKKNIVRVVAMLLVLLMVVGVLSAGFTALAAAKPYPTVLPRQEIFFQGKRFFPEQHYVVAKRGVLWVEEGTTLVIEGTLENHGLIRNDGTIIVTDVIGEDEDGYPYAPGNLSNQGTIENNGRIQVANAYVYNYPRAVFENKGTLELKSQKDVGTLFHNMVRPQAEYLYKAELINTGKIIVANEFGTGLTNHEGALLDNQGEIVIATPEGKVTGIVTGTPADSFQTEESQIEE